MPHPMDRRIKLVYHSIDMEDSMVIPPLLTIPGDIDLGKEHR